MATQTVGKGDKLIYVILLDGERLNVKIKSQAVVRDVLQLVLTHLELQETKYFGLMIVKDNQQEFLDSQFPLSYLSKYSPSLWKDDTSCNSSLVFSFFFRVKYYVENICFIREQSTRHQYYLQVRKDILENSLHVQDETTLVLASYALQADIGDYSRSTHGIDYFSPQDYIPSPILHKLGVPYIKQALPAMHRSHVGVTKSQAELEYLREAQRLGEYGFVFSKVFMMWKRDVTLFSLGVSLRGIIVCQENSFNHLAVIRIPWSKVLKVSYKNQSLLIHTSLSKPAEREVRLLTNSAERANYLLLLCQSFFEFSCHLNEELACPMEMFHQKLHGLDDRRHSSSSQAKAGTSLNQGMSKEKKIKGQRYEVSIIKKGGTLGIQIKGGQDTGGVLIASVSPYSPAAESGLIQPGDKLTSVNGVDISTMTQEQALEVLKSQPDRCVLQFESFTSSMDSGLSAPSVDHIEFSVHLEKKVTGIGLTFTTSTTHFGPAVVVSAVSPDIEWSNIKRGDILCQINSVDLHSFSLEQVTSMLSRLAIGDVVLHFKRASSDLLKGTIDRSVSQNANDLPSVVVCKKVGGSLGIKITQPTELGPIYVSGISEDRENDYKCKLLLKDIIHSVNGINVIGMPIEEVLAMIHDSQDSVELVVIRDHHQQQQHNLGGSDQTRPFQDRYEAAETSGELSQFSNNNEISIVLHRLSGSYGVAFKDTEEGVSIKSIDFEKHRSLHGMLEIDDRVVAVNGISVRMSTASQVTELIHCMQDSITLTIQKSELREEPETMYIQVGIPKALMFTRVQLQLAHPAGFMVSALILPLPESVCSRLKLGDLVTELNGVNLQGLTMEEIIKLASRGPDPIIATVECPSELVEQSNMHTTFTRRELKPSTSMDSQTESRTSAQPQLQRSSCLDITDRSSSFLKPSSSLSQLSSSLYGSVNNLLSMLKTAPAR